MSDNDHNPRVERPRVEPEIIPPRAQSRQRSFDSLFVRVEEGDDGIRRIYLKKLGPLTIVLLLLVAGATGVLFFVLLAGLMLLWIPLVIAGILVAMFSGQARELWSRVQGWFGGGSQR
jgi:ABC-type transport system involved in cytochrome bd biosynthesis fused ATPase/permease subunit